MVSLTTMTLESWMVALQLVWWGSKTLDRYMLRLKEQSNWSNFVVFHSCHKRLRSGNDKVSVVNSCALVPVCISGHHLVLLFYITAGCTPFLLSRPVMELLSITTDFGAFQVTVERFGHAMHPATRSIMSSLALRHHAQTRGAVSTLQRGVFLSQTLKVRTVNVVTRGFRTNSSTNLETTETQTDT